MKKLKTILLSQNWKQLFAVFLILWIAINLLQGIFTEIMNDESYYSLFGGNLAWGYYDHPPMVGLMTYISSLLFNSGLSVRFMTIIFQFFTLILIWKIIDEKAPDSKKVTLFAILSASMIMFVAYGFVTAPDVPLLFFTALFLFTYDRFLKKESWLNVLLLAVAMAGMVYSKYHAVLIIGLVVLSNLRLLTKYKAWTALLVAIILLIPHIYWQVSNDFPSFQYHLNARSSNFKWKYFFEYLPNQLAIFNPFTLGAFIYILVKYKARDTFERGLYFLTIGFLVFFWLMAFRGHVEPHWTVACTIPMLVLLYRRCLENRKLLRFIKNFATPVALLLLVVRIVLMTNLLPEKFGFNGKKEKYKALEIIAGDLPVVYTGSFQGPSLYHYFNKKESFVLSGIDSRQTQFDIWQKELQYQGKPVFICKNIEGISNQYVVDDYTFYGFEAKNFQSVNRIKIKFEINEEEVIPGDTLCISFEMHNPTDFDVDFNHAEFPVELKAAYTKRKWAWSESCVLEYNIDILPAKSTIFGSLKTVAPNITAGDYGFTLTLENMLCPAVNAISVPMKITEK